MNKIDSVVNLCARRRVIYPSSELYGSPAGFYNYGPLGAQLKRNVENSWWQRFVRNREDVAGMDGCVLTPRKVWEASGHLAAFNDPLVECKKCKFRERADHLIKQELGAEVEGESLEALRELVKKHSLKCPKCKGELAIGEPFNLMFKTHAGATADESSEAYLRPETAQLIFTDYKTLALAARLQPPFGIAQLGKAFRNEIAPRQFVFRCREFTQYELEYFYNDECPFEIRDGEVLALTAEDEAAKREAKLTKISTLPASKWMQYWLGEYLDWLRGLGLRDLRVRQHVKKELSHYSSDTWDVEFLYAEWGWKELLGIAERGTFDIDSHAKASGKDLSLCDGLGKKFVPRVIEPSGGIDRLLFAILTQAFNEKEEKSEKKTVLSLEASIAPTLACVFPLVKKDGIAEKAREAFGLLKGLAVEYDESGSIGKRYARADEAGTPFCVTVDYQTLEDGTVTLRARDTAKQERVKITELREKIG
ncbi:glycine--tRNA ligase [Candidatus Micrarchaeota archaeon CG_4_10_14_0_2_um_filter_60_11]|nr:MAG: glycine--tRNA ligase [Candidatus Micrarchaeota archaeon CG1_02_60_51]PIN96339.1 MAG: glycine--tRNA ligase [Candidatus Micrarchaeota archaeon CG10_big_fil_rev_8_21_14_0_10_60_32]PIO01726.1 MAG: glycine--tRNA ligase [Candidatus Micrarchaeota archaeon CG09_land_8_20_14_0_10_60_16]PIZ91106.1 MAG: glycine--tRNA ligase [Candidatus Micrarchaeota archaeon CG_4_10_14_0_2_um_filter_60_11]